ncbi:NAD+ synthase [Rhodothalassium salexigens]|uniref:NAD+ synthase n=1 Tax=Rhodothalassium salexigens TaxID=1086 RepID=UPI001912197B|nr:NAD+ synthase [Rhodothalassium salexigens]MBK5912407.1 NAD+ synthase [Rhodothalassium salexigens]MBK5921514.1 NAD+ synthase [Rhodothalassium salexigens]
MTDTLSLWLAQLNPTLGALDANVAAIRAARARAADAGADIVLTPEMSILGYPPEDLVLKPAFVAAVEAAVADLARDTADGGPALIVGGCRQVADAADHRVRNSVFVLDAGRIQAVRDKVELPNYGVFDEKRVFVPGPLPEPVTVRGLRLGLMICEDMWVAPVAAHLAAQGAEMLAVPTCSPYEIAKIDQRLAHARARVAETGLPLVFCNQVGGQDELAFDGASFTLDATGRLVGRLPAWQDAEGLCRLARDGNGAWAPRPGDVAALPGGLDEIYAAMVTGLRDYVTKVGFPGVLVGLSGGIDSALSAAVAVDALGPEAVRTVMMPSPYTSRASLEDAAECARLLGCRLDEIPIAPAMDGFDQMLAPLFEGRAADTTEENIQSRIRGVILMALSNKLGSMLLTTGNKSELAVGYATLYGDMAGGYSVLKDVYKTQVFALCRHRNKGHPQGVPGLKGPQGPVMPERVITKPPSAELRADQKDEDSLPPYEVLDAILTGLVDTEAGGEDLIAQGFDRATVAKVEHLLYVAEYKRRQAPPGVKITRRNFGRDRRYPLVNRFRTARP